VSSIYFSVKRINSVNSAIVELIIVKLNNKLIPWVVIIRLESIHKKGVLKVKLMLWITGGFIIFGFVVLVSMKKNMENKLAFIKTNMENNIESTKGSTKLIVWWIVGTTVWGIVSMILIVGWFHKYFS
jgi:hypothetical protein